MLLKLPRPPARTRPARSGTPVTALARLGSALGLALLASAAAGADESAWALAGQQGLVRFVIVPLDQARDRAAYLRQIEMLCEPERTCFLNFYTNSTGAALALPLPDPIDREATAVFRRSAKQGAERFQWSCRMQLEQECF